jgi:membrane associated rhomboid family serine protease
MIPIRDTIPSRNVPITMYLLILANVLIFLLQLQLPDESLQRFFYYFGIVPARYTHPAWAEYIGLPVDNYWPFVTSMFLHGGWFHLIGNMWTLWIFGDNVEDRMGPVRFLFFYLCCGIAAGIVHFLTNPNSTIPTIGASGAIAGVMGAYFLLFPHSRVITLIPIFFYPVFVALPAVVYLGIWFLTQFLSGVGSFVPGQQVGGIAWWAHIGGFVAGMVLCPLFVERKRPCRHCYPDQYGSELGWMRW